MLPGKNGPAEAASDLTLPTPYPAPLRDASTRSTSHRVSKSRGLIRALRILRFTLKSWRSLLKTHH